MKTLLYYACLLAACLLATSWLASPAPAQVWEEWVATYNGTGNGPDYSQDVTIDWQNNPAITGSATGAGTGFDFLTIKYNAQGQQLWTASFSGAPYGDVAYAIDHDNRGNLYTIGMGWGGGDNYYDYITIKYSPNGACVWTQDYNGPGNYWDSPFALAVCGDNIYVTGSAYNSNMNHAATIRYASDGQMQWLSYFESPVGSDIGESVTVSPDNRVAITGAGGEESGFPYYRIITAIYDSSGNQLWEDIYSGTAAGDQRGVAAAFDQDSDLIVAGYISNLNTQEDFCLVKYDQQGNRLWDQVYNGPGNGADKACGLALDPFGNIFVAGSSTGVQMNLDFVVIKYNAAGQLQWVYRYDGPGHGTDQAYDIATDGLGFVYAAGSSFNSGTNLDCFTVKLSPEGAAEWTMRFNGSANGGDEALAIALDWLWNVYITGYSASNFQGTNYVTIKYGQIVPPGLPPQITTYWPTELGTIPLGELTDFWAAATDPNGDSLLWQWRLDSSAVATDSFCTIIFDETGEHQVVCSVSDGQLADSIVWDVTVVPQNDPPEITSYFPVALDTIMLSSSIEFGASATDPDGDSLLWQWRLDSTIVATDSFCTITFNETGEHQVVCSVSDGQLADSVVWDVTVVPLGITGENPLHPSSFALYPPHPNPFNATTVIRFQLPVPSRINLGIFDTGGRSVVGFGESDLLSGFHEIYLDASSLTSGIYICRIEAGLWSAAQKLVLLK